MYDFKTVREAFPNAQMVGGRLIDYTNGKHVEIGLVSAKTGTFALTAAGQELMDAVKSAPVRAPRAPKPAPAPAAIPVADIAGMD
jgi:hypothetical protein